MSHKSSIPRENVVGKRDEGFAFAARRKNVESGFCATGVVERLRIRKVWCALFAEQAQNLAPLILRHGAIRDDCANQVIGVRTAALEQINDRQRDLAFAEIAADGL